MKTITDTICESLADEPEEWALSGDGERKLINEKLGLKLQYTSFNPSIIFWPSIISLLTGIVLMILSCPNLGGTAVCLALFPLMSVPMMFDGIKIKGGRFSYNLSDRMRLCGAAINWDNRLRQNNANKISEERFQHTQEKFEQVKERLDQMIKERNEHPTT